MIERKYYIRCTLLLIVIALAAIECAHGAAVLICNLSELGPASCIPTTDPSPADKVFVANDPSIGSGKVTDFKDFTLKDYGPISLDDLVGVCTNSIPTWTNCTKEWERKRLLPNNTVTAPPAPFKYVPSVCKDVQDNELRYKLTFFPEPRFYSAWFCDYPRFIQVNCHINFPLRPSPKKINPHAGMTAAEKKQLEIDATQFNLSNEESSDCDKFVDEVGPKAFIARSGTAKTRTLYYATPEHTKGASTGKTRLVDVTPCSIADRLIEMVNGQEVGTSYFAIIEDGKTIGYADCKLNGPVSK